MNITKQVTRFAIVAATLAFSSVSFAGIVANGSFSFTNTGGLITYAPATPGLLINATTVSIPAPTATGGLCPGICEEINTIPPTYLAAQNDFAAGGNTPLAINQSVSFNNYTFDLTFSSLPLFFFTTENGNRFTFQATFGQKGTATIGNTDFLNVSYNGFFTDSLGLYNPGSASLSLSFNQTGGATGAVAYSGTFATPPQPGSGIPEPTTMAMLGSALVALGVAGRKKLARR
jgi:hypothetical protein